MTNKKKKCVILTGSAGGIGSKIAKTLKKKYMVLGFDKIYKGEGFLDLTKFSNSPDAQEELYFKVKTTCQKYDLELFGIVNNAAVQKLGPLERLDLDDWNETVSVNLTAPMFLAKIFKQELTASNGRIINISSVHAISSKRDFSFYATSKAALLGLTRSLALELAPNVRVNAILPAAIETNMLKKGFVNKEQEYARLKSFHPLNDIGKTNDVAEIVKFLLSKNSKFITGSCIPIDGGILSRLHDPI